MSVKLLIESIELHYEGLDDRSKSVLQSGIKELLSECGQVIHHDEFLQSAPIDLEKATDGVVRSSSVSNKNNSTRHKKEELGSAMSSIQ